MFCGTFKAVRHRPGPPAELAQLHSKRAGAEAQKGGSSHAVLLCRAVRTAGPAKPAYTADTDHITAEADHLRATLGWCSVLIVNWP